MPPTEVLIYQEEDGSVPLRDWLDGLEDEARVRCLARLDLLADHGHELRRPHAENIGGGLLRAAVKFGRVNLRMLYFFHGRTAAVVSPGSPRSVDPAGDIKAARSRMARVQARPRAHTFRPEPWACARAAARSRGLQALLDRYIGDDPAKSEASRRRRPTPRWPVRSTGFGRRSG